MRKLMEGRGPGRPGVASKVGALMQTIREGGWCDEQGSLMRAFAYGILDPEGERYRLALLHSSQCPACRAYVSSLRGLAAVLPPVLLPWGLGAGVLAQAIEGVHAGGVAGAASGAGSAATGGGSAAGGASAGAQAGQSLSAALPASGAAGVGGATGGGWLLTGGPLSAKLAVGCLLALGVGAGCVALEGRHRGRAPGGARHSARRSGGDAGDGTLAADQLAGFAAGTASSRSALAVTGNATSALTPQRRASREFGPEQALASSAAGSVAAGGHVPAARSASSGSQRSGTAAGSSSGRSSTGTPSSSEAAGSAGGRSPAPSLTAAGDSAAAMREFAPG